MSEKITIEIDGRVCDAALGEMIIAVADREGIAIPRFCYHPKLSIAANCRMCLVEAEAGGRPFPKPVPACATPVAPGMKVLTRSPRALEAQRGTMEFLLINHPLDCPICDQGGECELQDVSMGYGDDISRFAERKRVVADENLGALIATDMTRCIHCTRCVRFSAEIAGVRELCATGRGEDMRIGTFIEHAVAHELSGNVIDLCPVGALTSKPYRFTARAWELTARDSIAPHDAVGSNVTLHVRGNRVMRVHPRENEAINETWISDRDRFSYEGLNSAARLTRPLVKRAGQWLEVDWPEALAAAAEALRTHAGDALGTLVGPQSTLEEQYLLQKLTRALDSRNIDARLRQQDFSVDTFDPLLPWLGVAIAELERQTAVLLIGSDIRHEQPLFAHRLRKAALKGGRIALVNAYRVALNHPSRQLIAPSGRLQVELAALAAALGQRARGAIGELIRDTQVSDAHQAIATDLRDAGQRDSGLILLGALAEADPHYSHLKALAHLLAKATGCRVGYLPRAAGSVGAYIAGALPHRGPGARYVSPSGLDAGAQISDPRRAYLLWGLDPALDCLDPRAAVAACARAEQVIACAAFRSDTLDAVATVQLPIGAFAETAGTFVNAAGDWQRFQGAVAPPGDARPGWKVLRVIGNLLDFDGFEHASARDVHDELAAQCRTLAPDNQPRGDWLLDAAPSDSQLMRVGAPPIYAVDSLARHAPALARTPLAESLTVRLHPRQAAELRLTGGERVRIRQGEAQAEALVILDDGVALGAARVPAAVPGSDTLGPQIGPITLEKV